MAHPFTIAIIGNPNSGKSSLFNALTGLNQKISNYPGITVEKKVGEVLLTDKTVVEVIDFPGIYSLYPNSSDEKIVVETLTNPADENYPDAIIYVAASMELEKHFLLATQLRQLNIPMIFCLTMSDLADDMWNYDLSQISEFLGISSINVSSLTGKNIPQLKEGMLELIRTEKLPSWKNAYPLTLTEKAATDAVVSISDDDNEYSHLLIAHHQEWLSHVTTSERNMLATKLDGLGFKSTKSQIEETLWRYNHFTAVIDSAKTEKNKGSVDITEKIDDVITHRIAGPLIFFAIMFLMFQAIYSWSEAPMGWIESFFSMLSSRTRDILPAGWVTDLLTDGVIAGLGGILVFIPQITFLFLMISALEEVGYMSRAVFMFDNVMQRFGLNGRSLVALVSSGACAIPAIMSTRTIANWKERLITIMVAPLISCSARLPVYTVLVALVVPAKKYLGIFHYQGLAFMGLYLLSIAAALVSAYIFNKIIQTEERSFLMIELPQYKKPLWRNVLITVREKVSAFVWEAGKVILIISIILWFLASYGPPAKMNLIEMEHQKLSETSINNDELNQVIAAKKLEASYAGHLGKWLEPAIAPLGYDWKIGIALITSFAAREVFVGTMATIYSVGNVDDTLTLREKLAAEINPITGEPRYNPATSWSLLIFYVFALQCMSTLAVTKRETNSWKWPIIQFFFMGIMAYMSALGVYHWLS